MLTFLASAKSFIGHTDKIQRNAIRSWQAVHPDAEVIIYGDGEGVADACREMGVCHIPHIPCSPSGVPYFNGIVEHARTHARYDVQCYINCDILMSKEVIKAIKSLEFPQYLVIGQRIDLTEGVEIDVTSCDWKIELQKLTVQEKASLHGPTAMDYFIFPRGMWSSLAPLVIGRAGYDGALIAYCLRKKIPIINASLTLPVLHQFHEYGHVSGGVDSVWGGEDATNNKKIHNVKHSIPDSTDAQWLIVNETLIPNSFQKDWMRRIELALRFNMGFDVLSLFIRLLWRLAVATGIYRVRSLTLQDVLCSNPLRQ